VSSPNWSTPELQAAIDLVNTYDELNDPKDGLTSIEVVHRLLRRHDLDELAGGLTRTHLAAVRRLREDLRRVFLAAETASKADVLNDILGAAGAQLRLRNDPPGWTMTAHSTRRGQGPLAAALAAALAGVVASDAGGRLGVCAAHPCRCVFVDATRAHRQRYCCELCNDRVASAAYRRRTRTTAGDASG
jgi:predicted RNA-binding Zn ribbon-like protein